MTILVAVAWILIGSWGVVNLSEGDWFIGGVMLACAVTGLWSLTGRVLRQRHSGGGAPPVNRPAR